VVLVLLSVVMLFVTQANLKIRLID